MASRPAVFSRRLVLACLVAATAIVAGPVAAALPSNLRVSPDEIDKALADGDPVVQAAFDDVAKLFHLAIWETAPTRDPKGSSINVARSTDGGLAWQQLGQIPQGQEYFLGDPQAAWDPLTKRFYVAIESCFPPANKCPPNVVFSTDFGSTWSQPNDIWKSIATNDKEFATNPFIALDRSEERRVGKECRL